VARDAEQGRGPDQARQRPGAAAGAPAGREQRPAQGAARRQGPDGQPATRQAAASPAARGGAPTSRRRRAGMHVLFLSKYFIKLFYH